MRTLFCGLLIVSALCLGAVGFLRAQTPPQTCELSVQLQSLRNRKGQALLALYDNAKAFPGDSKRAVQEQALLLKAGETPSVTFANLKPGVYAVSVLHDENGNGKMDTRRPFGVPKEGFGASGKPRSRLRAPRFEEAKIEVSLPKQSITVRINYL